MDILRKELEEVYASQNLQSEELPPEMIFRARDIARSIAQGNDGCAVITDASKEICHVFSGSFGKLLGYASSAPSVFTVDSSDEDAIYERIDPEDLVDKRLLEYEFFKQIDRVPKEDKLKLIASCRIRMKDRTGVYRSVDNTTQLLIPSPAGKIWLILCTYRLSPEDHSPAGIMPAVINTATGESTRYAFESTRKEILSVREKEVLSLIRDGKLSKQIADLLHISVHTVNRHRQNILEKLSVGNSVEAVKAATLMKLL